MIGHATIGKNSNPKFTGKSFKLLDEFLIVPPIMKNCRALIAAVDDMVTSAGIFDSEWANHCKKLTRESNDFKQITAN